MSEAFVTERMRRCHNNKKRHGNCTTTDWEHHQNSLAQHHLPISRITFYVGSKSQRRLAVGMRVAHEELQRDETRRNVKCLKDRHVIIEKRIGRHGQYWVSSCKAEHPT